MTSLLAQTPAPWIDLAQYGVLGLVVLMLILGKVVPGVLHDRIVRDITERCEAAEEAAERERAENTRLNGIIRDQVIPAVVRATDAQAALLEYRIKRSRDAADG